MSSTSDSNPNTIALTHQRPRQTSPKKYSKRITYGATRESGAPSPAGETGGHHVARTRHRERATQPGQAASTGECPAPGAGGSGRSAGVGRGGPGRVTNRGCAVFIVFLALFLDCLMLTAMVPIIPNYLREQTPDKTGNASHHLTTPLDWPRNLSGLPLSDAWNTSGVALFSSAHVARSEVNGTYSNENTRISLLFASKTLVQVAFNLVVGPLSERIGYTIPMFVGFVILLFSTVAFAFSNTYELLFAARAFQGVGTAFSTTAGMGLLASLYPDQNERAAAQTKAFSGLALGVFLGPPYGGTLYDLFGCKEAPCLILAVLVLLEGVLQWCVMRPRLERQTVAGTSFIALLTDPYILVTAATIAIANLTTAVLEPALPIWMFYTMGAPTWLQGIVFVPLTVSYLLFLHMFGMISTKIKCFKVSQRWIHTMVGMIVLAVSTSMIPYSSDFYQMIGPLLVLGFGLAQVCTCMLPHIGTLVDLRHQPVYGSAYAITDNAFSIAFAVGPTISGPLIDTVGFVWTLRGVSLLILLFTPVVVILRNPPGRATTDENTVLVTSCSDETAAGYSSCKRSSTPVTSH